MTNLWLFRFFLTTYILTACGMLLFGDPTISGIQAIWIPVVLLGCALNACIGSITGGLMVHYAESMEQYGSTLRGEMLIYGAGHVMVIFITSICGDGNNMLHLALLAPAAFAACITAEKQYAREIARKLPLN